MAKISDLEKKEKEENKEVLKNREDILNFSSLSFRSLGNIKFEEDIATQEELDLVQENLSTEVENLSKKVLHLSNDSEDKESRILSDDIWLQHVVKEIRNPAFSYPDNNVLVLAYSEKSDWILSSDFLKKPALLLFTESSQNFSSLSDVFEHFANFDISANVPDIEDLIVPSFEVGEFYFSGTLTLSADKTTPDDAFPKPFKTIQSFKRVVPSIGDVDYIEKIDYETGTLISFIKSGRINIILNEEQYGHYVDFGINIGFSFNNDNEVEEEEFFTNNFKAKLVKDIFRLLKKYDYENLDESCFYEMEDGRIIKLESIYAYSESNNKTWNNNYQVLHDFNEFSEFLDTIVSEEEIDFFKAEIVDRYVAENELCSLVKNECNAVSVAVDRKFLSVEVDPKFTAWKESQGDISANSQGVFIGSNVQTSKLSNVIIGNNISNIPFEGNVVIAPLGFIGSLSDVHDNINRPIGSIVITKGWNNSTPLNSGTGIFIGNGNVNNSAFYSGDADLSGKRFGPNVFIANDGVSIGNRSINIGHGNNANTYSTTIGNFANTIGTGTNSYLNTQFVRYCVKNNASNIAIGSGNNSNGTAIVNSYSINMPTTHGIAIGVTNIGETPATVSANYAIQIGNGVNNEVSSFQVYDKKLLNQKGFIPFERIKGLSVESYDFNANILIGNGVKLSGNSKGAIAIGSATKTLATGVNGDYSIALGYNAHAIVSNAVQIGAGTNSFSNSLKFRNTEIVNSNGVIPAESIEIGSDLSSIARLSDVSSNVSTTLSGFKREIHDTISNAFASSFELSTAEDFFKNPSRYQLSDLISCCGCMFNALSGIMDKCIV